MGLVYGPYLPRPDASPAVRAELEGWFGSLSPDGEPCVERLSAEERARTVRAIIDPTTKPEELVRPGHLFPLVAKEGGGLKIDWADQIVAGTALTRDGRIIHPQFTSADPTPLEAAAGVTPSSLTS